MSCASYVVRMQLFYRCTTARTVFVRRLGRDLKLYLNVQPSFSVSFPLGTLVQGGISLEPMMTRANNGLCPMVLRPPQSHVYVRCGVMITDVVALNHTLPLLSFHLRQNSEDPLRIYAPSLSACPALKHSSFVQDLILHPPMRWQRLHLSNTTDSDLEPGKPQGEAQDGM